MSSIYFYEKTVKKLSDKEKDAYHIENMLAAKLVLVDNKRMPQTYKELEGYVKQKSEEKDVLLLTDVAKDVKEIIVTGPVPFHIKPIWPFISFMALHTLPEEFREVYKIKHTRFHELIVKFNLGVLKIVRPFLPPFFRLIAPARWAKQRLNNNPNLLFKDKANF